jgi:hypothetical protein
MWIFIRLNFKSVVFYILLFAPLFISFVTIIYNEVLTSRQRACLQTTKFCLYISWSCINSATCSHCYLHWCRPFSRVDGQTSSGHIEAVVLTSQSTESRYEFSDFQIANLVRYDWHDIFGLVHWFLRNKSVETLGRECMYFFLFNFTIKWLMVRTTGRESLIKSHQKFTLYIITYGYYKNTYYIHKHWDIQQL